MKYNSKKYEFSHPKSDRVLFEKIVRNCVAKFPENMFCKKIKNKTITIENYCNILKALFAQPYYGSNALAIAGANCDMTRHEVRDYLIKHAEEEKTHWTWILNDLKNMNQSITELTSEFPSPNAQAYIAFNYFIAMKAPIARLGIAYMLESIGASYGKEYGTLLCQALKLKPTQVSFLFGHGDTDVGHTDEILNLLNSSDLTPEEWAWMGHAAQVGFKLYNQVYEEAA